MAKKKAEPKEKISTKQPVRADINPQLCKVLNENKFVFTKPWIIEPKFDGLRCWMVVDSKGKATPYSRNGRPLWNMKSVIEEVEEVCFQNYVLDGELHSKDWNLSMGILKSSVTEHAEADKLNFHVWDSLTIDEVHATWTDVQKHVHTCFSDVSNHARKQDRLWPWIPSEKWTDANPKHVTVVPTRFVSSHEELKVAYLEFLEQGYEGAILKDPDAGYYGGRRGPNWLKIKPWTDADLLVVGSYPGEGKHLGRIGGLVLEGSATWNGETYQVKTEVGTGFSDQEREEFQLLAETNTLNGRTVEIKFQDITVEGACRFPVFHRLRDDK